MLSPHIHRHQSGTYHLEYAFGMQQTMQRIHRLWPKRHLPSWAHHHQLRTREPASRQRGPHLELET